MKGIAKGILITILISVVIVLLSNLAFFVPWYITMITETFNISQVVATDNYLKQTYYDDTMDRLKDRPIFKEKPGSIVLEVRNADGRDAVGNDDPSIYYGSGESSKPYMQRGEPLSITLTAAYPFSITLWGNDLERTTTITYTMRTSGLKLYKDLQYN